MLVLMNETGSTLQRIANNTHVSLATSVHLERSFLQVSFIKIWSQDLQFDENYYLINF